MSEEELDWDEDFDLDDDNQLVPTSKLKGNDGEPAPLVLSGVAANPDEEENWDDDFDLELPSTNLGKASTSPRKLLAKREERIGQFCFLELLRFPTCCTFSDLILLGNDTNTVSIISFSLSAP